MKDGECSKDGHCCCVCHKVVGILVALVGLTILLGTFDVLSARIVSIVWPILVILIGLKKSFGAGKCKCCSRS